MTAVDTKEQKRGEILAAAKAAFAANGYHATKIGQVAEQAGVSYGSIYWYFESKDCLLYTSPSPRD